MGHEMVSGRAVVAVGGLVAERTTDWLDRGGMQLIRDVCATEDPSGVELREKQSVAAARSDAEKRLIDLFGEKRVVTAAMAGMPAPYLRYSQKSLDELVEQNKDGANWRMVCASPDSLRLLWARRGIDREKQPCFYPDQDWWLKQSESRWSSRQPAPGYYAINYAGQFGGTSWHNQEKEIVKLGKQYERADEVVVAQGCFGFFDRSGGKERLLEGVYHWSNAEASDGNRVYVGGFARVGFFVDSYRPDDNRGLLRVCLFRKFDS